MTKKKNYSATENLVWSVQQGLEETSCQSMRWGGEGTTKLLWDAIRESSKGSLRSEPPLGKDHSCSDRGVRGNPKRSPASGTPSRRCHSSLLLRDHCRPRGEQDKPLDVVTIHPGLLPHF